jgi:hypothetical protein
MSKLIVPNSVCIGVLITSQADWSLENRLHCIFESIASGYVAEWGNTHHKWDSLLIAFHHHHASHLKRRTKTQGIPTTFLSR